MRRLLFACLVLGLTYAAAQSSASAPDIPKVAPSAPPGDYLLGPGDLLSVMVTDLPDDFTTERTFRVDTSGDVILPYAGRVHAAGFNIEGLSKEIEANLTVIIKDPHVIVGVAEFHSQPVSILGEVNEAGVHQVESGKRLLEVLALGKGFTEFVGNRVTITRNMRWGRLPLEGAQSDPTGQFSMATLQLKELMASKSPEQNILIMPNDVISVSRQEFVYAVGEVTKPGGFSLGEQETITALQVLSLAEGLTRTAASKKAMILRTVTGSKARTQIPIDVKELMAGKASDVALQADDILFIPNSTAKAAGYRTIDAIVNAATGVVLYGSHL
jgi:polysaccharide biosynthesis/export protein